MRLRGVRKSFLFTVTVTITLPLLDRNRSFAPADAANITREPACSTDTKAALSDRFAAPAVTSIAPAVRKRSEYTVASTGRSPLKAVDWSCGTEIFPVLREPYEIGPKLEEMDEKEVVALYISARSSRLDFFSRHVGSEKRNVFCYIGQPNVWGSGLGVSCTVASYSAGMDTW